MLESQAINSGQDPKQDYSIFKEISSTDSKITELAGNDYLLGKQE